MSETARKHKAEAPTSLNFAIIICSSSRYQGLQLMKHVDDPSGDLITETLKHHGHTVVSRKIVPDNKPTIEQNVKEVLKLKTVDAVITCGGTGISSTDVTIEAVEPMLDKELPGFGEIFRRLSFEEIGSAALLSRAVAGVTDGKAVFCVPGSPQAVRLCLERLILPEAGHILKHVRER